MRRIHAALLGGATAAVLTLTACGGGTGSKTSGGGGGSGGAGSGKVSSIKLMAAEYSKEHTASFWNAFAKTYQQKYGTKLDVQVVSWNDIDQQSSTTIQSNNPPDILNLNAYASYAKDGLLYNADQVLSSSVKNDLLPNFIKSGSYKGKLYGMPDLSSARALFYNKTLFKKAGIASPPKTWAQFESDAKKITALGNGVVGYAMPLGPEEAQAEFSIWLFNNHGDWKTNGKWTINSKQNLQALQFLRKLALTDKVTQPNPAKTNRTDGAFPLFSSGKAGMVVGFSPLQAQLNQEKTVSYGIAPMPTSDGSTPNTYGVTDYLMAFKKNGNQQAVKDFYSLYYQKDQVNKFIKAEGFLPVTKSGLNYFASDATIKPYLSTLTHVRLEPTDDPKWDTIKIAVQQNIGAAVQPNGNPKQVLDQLQAKATGS